MKHRGMTLVELMVAMAVGLGITLAVTSLLISSQNNKRVTTTTNDAEQTGDYAFYELSKVIGGAGSAIAESAFPTDVGVMGCKLNAGIIFPRTTPFPAPFTNFLAGVTNTLVVAPVLIAQGQSHYGSDVLVIMGGSGAAGGVSRQVSGGGNSSTLNLDNTVGFFGNDVALVSQNGVVDCLLEQVTSATPPTVNLNTTGVYYTLNGTTTDLPTLASSTSTYFTPIGNASANNIQFMLFGVGTDRILYSYDLLQNLNLVQGQGGDSSQAVADQVMRLSALYGIDTNGDGIQDTWVDPGIAPWDITTVMANPAQMKQIVSIRVALVVRNDYYDLGGGTPSAPNAVSPSQLYIFNNLTDRLGTALPTLKKTINLVGIEQQYRYRVFEFTVPLRNMIILAGA